MSTELIYELFQWMSIVALLLLVLAVYRQLGLMVTGPAESQAHAFGPLVGKEPGDRLLSLFPEDVASWRVIVFAREDCSACEDLMGQILVWSQDETLVGFSLAVVADGSVEYRKGLQANFGVARTETADEFLDDGKRLDGRTLPAYPFSILISPGNKVSHKQVGSDGDAIRRWLVKTQEPEQAAVAEIR
jgi:hypothetical protein